MEAHVLGDYVLAELEAIRALTEGKEGWDAFNMQIETAMELALEKVYQHAAKLSQTQ